MANEQHLTIIEAAKYLGKSTKTVRKYIKEKKLAAEVQDSPFGFRYIITIEALEAMGSAKTVSNGVPEETLPMVPPSQHPVEVLENLVMGMEARLLEAIEARLEARDKKLEEALERLAGKPWWKRFW